MNKRKSTILTLPLLLLFCLLSCQTIVAQSTLVNVPSTDVVPAKGIYLEMDFITNYAWQRTENSFQNYLPRAVVGLGNNLEAGVNVSYTRVPGGGAPVELQPNMKWRFYENEEKGLAASVGCIWFVPVTHRSNTHTIGNCYSVLSKQWKGSYGPRFTGGAYTMVNARRDDGSRVGAIVGYEQPLSKKVGFIVDWFSGENRFGYISPGFRIITAHNGSLLTGYSNANHDRSNNSFFAYYGLTF